MAERTSDSAPDQPFGPRRKRVKIDTACNGCRERKVKCDGVRPACARCKRRVRPCIYVHDDHRVRHSQAERTIRPERVSHQDASLTPQRPRKQARPVGPLGSSPSDPSPLASDSMTGVAEAGTSAGNYFGSSSAASFTKQIKAAIDAQLGSRSARDSPAPGPATAAKGTTIDDLKCVLPTRRQADSLLDVYWTYVDPLYPFLTRRSWQRSYEALFAGNPLGTDERIFLSTLNYMFAIATQLLERLPPDERQTSSDEYFQRGQDLIRPQQWEDASVELVQCLLIATQYLQSTNQPLQTWMLVGSAIRMAQALGLHLPSTASAVAGRVEQETLRRVWHGCVVMDRMVCVTHGRPAMISGPTASAVPVPDCFDHDEEDGDGRFAFFVNSAKLYEISHRGILTLYSETGGHLSSENASSPGEFSNVLSLDDDLSSWEQQLPKHLTLASYNPHDGFKVAYRQAVILQLRFHHARILLLRPVFSTFCLGQSHSQQNVDGLKSRMIKQCALLSVGTAQKIISLLAQHKSEDGTVGLLPAWWYRVYYIYTAATILIAAKLRPETFDMAEILRSWTQAIQLLEGHEKFGQAARRCLAALQILSSKIHPEAFTADTLCPQGARTGGHVGEQSNQPPASPTADGMPSSVPTDEFGEGLADLAFDVNDFAWLNDMNAWGVLNSA